jgi:hypothetical protein
MTGNKNKARPDAYGEENSNPAATGNYLCAHEAEGPVYKSIRERETYMEISLTREPIHGFVLYRAFLMLSRAVLMT